MRSKIGVGSWEPTRSQLLTAAGDLFLTKPAGLFRRRGVFLLDTYLGTVKQVAPSWDDFKASFKTQGADVGDWFKADLVVALRERGLVLDEGHCYSPVHPPALGGSYELENFEKTSWRVHISIMGQIHEQVKDLPEGTPITGIRVVDP